jgi:hypothetical protein
MPPVVREEVNTRKKQQKLKDFLQEIDPNLMKRKAQIMVVFFKDLVVMKTNNRLEDL